MAVTASRHAARRAFSVPHAGLDAVRRAATGALIGAAVVSAISLLIAGLLFAYHTSHRGEIYAGTRAADLDLSGKSRAEAQHLLQARFDAYLQRPMTFTVADTAITATPAELGVRFNTAAMVEQAYDFGRGSTLWIDTRDWLDALAGGHTISTAVAIDRATFRAVMGARLASAAIPAKDAAFARGPDGQVVIESGQPGVAIDLQKTYEAFAASVAALSSDSIAIATVEVEPSISAGMLEGALDEINDYSGAPLDVILDTTVWRISADDLLAMTTVETTNGETTVAFSRNLIRRYIGSLAPRAYTPATNADVRNSNGTFEAIPAHNGHKLDIEASTDAAIAALEQGEHEVVLLTQPVLPQVSDADVQDAIERARDLSSSPITLTWEGGTKQIDAKTLAAAIAFDVNPARNPAVAVTFDETTLRASAEKLLKSVAARVKVEPVDAHLRWYNGQVQVQSPEELGRELDLDATVEQIARAARSGTAEVAIVTKDVKPQVTADMAGSIQLGGDIISEGNTYYGDSAANRYHNVQLAASRVNGELVPPGGTFSFNRAVGPVTFDSGYRTGYGIIATNGNISTIPSVGGGICQVATTIFQAAFRAGFPIGERNWHLYWIPRYGSSSSGMKGLDATVDPDYGLDFTFKNTTNNWIAVVYWYDGASVHAEIRGTNPGWQVQIDPPVITDVVPASQEMHYENSDEIPAGTTVFVEHAEDGFVAAIHRVVRDSSGNVIDEITLVSTYAPAQNTTLVGTGPSQ